jgi:DNA-binding PadR family transcriptional regulator
VKLSAVIFLIPSTPIRVSELYNKILSQSSELVTAINLPTNRHALYNALSALETAGYIQSAVLPVRGGEKTVQLTEKGLRFLNEFYEFVNLRPKSSGERVEQFLAKLTAEFRAKIVAYIDKLEKEQENQNQDNQKEKK